MSGADVAREGKARQVGVTHGSLSLSAWTKKVRTVFHQRIWLE